MAKILLYCGDVVGQSMAGPAIRYWEFAKVLAKSHEVILMIPNRTDIQSDTFTIVTRSKKDVEYFKKADLIISLTISTKMAWIAKKYGVGLILDAYDPIPLEHLEIFSKHPMQLRIDKNISIVKTFNFSFQMADFILCANEQQRNLWTGLSLGLNKITPSLYDFDHSLNSHFGIVPFGLSPIPPKKTSSGMRAMFNLKSTDKVLLWGGGIWNWFDPLTLIKAIHLISQQRDDVKLVFMGIKHPSNDVPEMEMSCNAIQLAKDLNLLDKSVFFNYKWIPYEQRANFLLEADIGVSTHFEHLETHFAFRTRFLDYIWAGLPIIATKGDSFANLIVAENIGRVVPECDSHLLAKTIVELLDNPQEIKLIKNNLVKLQERFHWERVVKPISEMINIFISKAKQRLSFADFKYITSKYIDEVFGYFKRAYRKFCELN